MFKAFFKIVIALYFNEQLPIRLNQTLRVSSASTNCSDPAQIHCHYFITKRP